MSQTLCKDLFTRQVHQLIKNQWHCLGCSISFWKEVVSLLKSTRKMKLTECVIPFEKVVGGCLTPRKNKCNLTLTWAHLPFLKQHVEVENFTTTRSSKSFSLLNWNNAHSYSSFKDMNQCLVNYCQVNFFHRKKAMHNSPPCSGTGGLKNATGCSGNGSDITAGGLQKHPILLRGGITPTSDTPHYLFKWKSLRSLMFYET